MRMLPTRPAPAKKFKKIKAKKELEAGKNKWQDFNRQVQVREEQ